MVSQNKFLNKTIAFSLSIALVSPIAVLSSTGVKAATTSPTTGKMEYSLLDDDGKTVVASDKVVVTNLSKQSESVSDYLSAWGYRDGTSGTTNGGKVVAKENLTPGKYAVTAKVSDKVTVTSFVEIKASNSATKVKATALPTAEDVDLKRSGKISGVTEPNSTLVVKNTTTAWSVKADENGKFEVYLPAGTYDIILDTDKDKKNKIYPIKVQAGQNNLPFTDLSADTGVSGDFGYTISKDKDGLSYINPSSKEYKGKAAPGTLVRAYSVNNNNTEEKNDDIYTLLGEAVTKSAAKGSDVGDFSIKLKEAQPDKTIKIIVEDKSYNSYSPDLSILGKIDPKLLADSKAVVGKDANITFTDKSGLLLTSKDLKVTLKGSDTDPVELKVKKKEANVWTGDYTIANGKLTISNETFIKNITDFSKDTTFTVKLTASGFEDSSITQTVKSVTAPALTASVTKATSEGIKLTAAATKSTENKIFYKISSKSIDAPKLYSSVTEVTELKISPSDDIKGVDATTNKFLGVYELNSKSQIVKFKQITLSASNIKEAVKTN